MFCIQKMLEVFGQSEVTGKAGNRDKTVKSIWDL